MTLALSNAWAQEEEMEEEDAFGGIMHTSIPLISDVTYAPTAPKAGEPVTVSCKVKMSEEEEETTVKTVQAGYSTDGTTWNAVELKPEGAEGTYSGEIPGQSAGANVTFYIRAVDTTRNVATEMPYKTSWPATKQNLIPGAVDIDNSEDIVPNDLDYLETYYGYDDQNMYIGFKVQGNVTGGTMDPPYIQIYGAKFTNPDVDQGEGLMVGKLVIYVPLGKELFDKFKEELDKVGFQFPENKMGMIDIQKIMSNPAEGYLKTAAPEGKVDDGFFVGRFKKSALGDNPSGCVRGLYLTAANASLESFMPIPLNATPYTMLCFTNHSYQVAGAPAKVATAAPAEKAPSVAAPAAKEKPLAEAEKMSSRDKKRLRNFGYFLGALIIGVAIGSN